MREVPYEYPPQVDFDELLVKVKKPRVGINELTILGGHCAENCFEKFVGQWLEQREIKLPFRIWEYASEIIFRKKMIHRKTSMWFYLNVDDCLVKMAI